MAESGDVPAGTRFLYDTELSYYQEMSAFMRQLGVKYPISGSNFPPPILASMKANAQLDLVTSNEYWDHPQMHKIDYDWSRRVYAPIDNRSQLLSPASNLVHSKSYFQVQNKPMMITEWNHCYPNEYVLEGALLMAAYGRLQGWDGIMQFESELPGLGEQEMDSYNLSGSAEDLASWVLAAPLFLRGDISAATHHVVEGITDQQTLSVPSYSTFLEDAFWLPYVSRVSKNYDGQEPGRLEGTG